MSHGVPPHLTLLEGCELEAGQVAPQLGVAGCLLELPICFGAVKLGREGLRETKVGMVEGML